jgi:hypothetical protein
MDAGYVYVINKNGKLFKVPCLMNVLNRGDLLLDPTRKTLPMWWPINLIVVIALSIYFFVKPEPRYGR